MPRKQSDNYNAQNERKMYATLEGRAARLYRNARQRAECYNVPIEITPSWVEEKLRAGMCELTGIKFDLEPRPGEGRNPFSPSIDRIKGSDGYTLANSRLVCSAINLAFNEFGAVVFEHVAQAYFNHSDRTIHAK